MCQLLLVHLTLNEDVEIGLTNYQSCRVETPLRDLYDGRPRLYVPTSRTLENASTAQVGQTGLLSSSSHKVSHNCTCVTKVSHTAPGARRRILHCSGGCSSYVQSVLTRQPKRTLAHSKEEPSLDEPSLVPTRQPKRTLADSKEEPSLDEPSLVPTRQPKRTLADSKEEPSLDEPSLVPTRQPKRTLADSKEEPSLDESSLVPTRQPKRKLADSKEKPSLDESSLVPNHPRDKIRGSVQALPEARSHR
jgi:hypothetical protein